MVHNLAIDRLRERQRTRHIDLTRQQSSSNSERDTELRDMAILTESIIASLPEKQRLAIHLRDVEGFEMAEIAEIIECDETGARMNLSRARKSVREQLLKIMNYGV
jgi:RNA polymerase sigma-70 factor (ECF subfamily)